MSKKKKKKIKITTKLKCRICGKKKKYEKFDHGKDMCSAIRDACVKCVASIRAANSRGRS